MSASTRTTIGVIVLVLLVYLAGEFGLGGVGTSPTRPTGNANARSDGSVEVTELYSAYQANEVAADQRFRGRSFVFSGIVDQVKKDFRDSAYVLLRVPGTLLGVHADVASAAMPSMSRLASGQRVRLRCTGDQMIMGVPRLKDCELDAPKTSQQPLPQVPRESSPVDRNGATGIYDRRITRDDESATWTVTMLPEVAGQARRIALHFIAIIGPEAHNGELTDTVTVTTNFVRVERDRCQLALAIYPESLRVTAGPDSDEHACDFGMGVFAAGLYRRRHP